MARDHLGELVGVLTHDGGQVMLVRPDGHLAWRGATRRRRGPEPLAHRRVRSTGSRDDDRRPVAADPETPPPIWRSCGPVCDLFIERGVEGTSMEQIAKKAGVGKPTIYRRWAGKEELIAAAMETLVADEVGGRRRRRSTPTSPYELVEAAIERAAAHRHHSAVPRPGRQGVRLGGQSPAADGHLLGALHPAAAATRDAALLERARQLGTVAEDIDVDVAIDMMVGAITYRVLQPDPPDVNEMRRYLRAVYRQIGLLPG